MKKIKLLLILILFFSCTQEEFTTEKLLLSNSENLKNILNSQIIINPIDIERYITNPKDLDDEKINRQLLNIGLASRNLFANGKLNSLILSEAKKVENNAISFTKIINNINNKNENYSKLSSTLQNLDLKHKSQNPANKGFVEKYIPAIFVPNIEAADVSKHPIISSGIVVNSELKNMEQYEDYIVAWYFENEKWVEFLLNEKMSMKITNPIFIIDNAEKTITNRKKEKLNSFSSRIVSGGSSTNTNNSSTTTDYYSHQYKINYRFESSGRSELYITAAYIGSNTTGMVLKDNKGYYKFRKKLASVRKRWIGDWRWHFVQSSQGEIHNYTFWNTFERDWYCSPKNLGSASRYNITIFLSGRRKYSGEWYAYSPLQVNANPLTLTPSKYYTNSRGGLLIQNH